MDVRVLQLSHSFAMAQHVRRRLQANATAPETGAGSALYDASSADGEDASESALSADQVMTLTVSGWLALALYGLLALAIAYMAVQHFAHGSSPRKRVFHVLLLLSVLLNVPDPLGWLLWPESESWVYTYPMRIYSLLLQSVCKSIVSIAWSEVVSAGQSYERRRVTYVVMVFNGILALWGVSVPILLARYPNDVYGQYEFMESPLRAVMTYSGVGVIFVYGLLLAFQGMRLRRRLVQAKGTVPTASVEKSLSQLMLTLVVIVLADVLRVGSLALNEANVEMPFIVFLVLNNLVPNIFPTICMLYLMRRYGAKDSRPEPPSAPQRKPPATLSRYMTDDRDSDLTGTPVLGMSKFTLPPSRIASVDRVELDSRGFHQAPAAAHEVVDSRGTQHTLTPMSHWVRK